MAFAPGERLTLEGVVNALTLFIMDGTKRYLVKWRTPTLQGALSVDCDNFNELGQKILEASGTPMECPWQVESITLIDPCEHIPESVFARAEQQLEIGVDPDTREVALNVPVCDVAEGFWHIAFSPRQAVMLAEKLIHHSLTALDLKRAAREVR